MAIAHARHILVPTEDHATNLKTEIEGGADFGEVAKQHSTCPSGAQGGDLGQFGPGQMVSEFDQVIWSEALGQVHGPVQTQFGFHLIEILSRDD